MYSIQSAIAFSKIGKRANNEDSVYPFLEGDARTENLRSKIPSIHNLYLVCDGVGGASKGEIASQLICTNFPLYFSDNPPAEVPLSQDYLQKGVVWVEKAMDLFIEQNPESRGMASTLTLAYFDSAGVNICWAGDSRVYHFRNGKVLYQTEDHSLVNELVKSGQIKPEDAETHPQKNIILRAVQGCNNPTPISYHFISWNDVQIGDEFLLCSDGVTETWVQTALTALFSDDLNQDSRLNHMEMACSQQSRDNYSAYLIQIGERLMGKAEEPDDTPNTMHFPVEGSGNRENITIIENSVEVPLTVTTSNETPVSEVVPPIVEEVVVPPVTKTVMENIHQTIQKNNDAKIPPIAQVQEKPRIEQNPPSPKKTKYWLIGGIVGAVIVLGTIGLLWYYISGPGSANVQFQKYYTQALAKISICEKTGKCTDAKGLANQAKSAAETMAEHKKADSLIARVSRKEEEVKKHSTLNVPEPTDKGKVDDKAAGSPKSKTPTPKTTTTAPASTTVTPKATTDKPTTPATTTAPKVTTPKPAETTAKTTKPPVQVSPANIPADKVKSTTTPPTSTTKPN